MLPPGDKHLVYQLEWFFLVQKFTNKENDQ